MFPFDPDRETFKKSPGAVTIAVTRTTAPPKSTAGVPPRSTTTPKKAAAPLNGILDGLGRNTPLSKAAFGGTSGNSVCRPFSSSAPLFKDPPQPKSSGVRTAASLSTSEASKRAPQLKLATTSPSVRASSGEQRGVGSGARMDTGGSACGPSAPPRDAAAGRGKGLATAIDLDDDASDHFQPQLSAPARKAVDADGRRAPEPAPRGADPKAGASAGAARTPAAAPPPSAAQAARGGMPASARASASARPDGEALALTPVEALKLGLVSLSALPDPAAPAPAPAQAQAQPGPVSLRWGRAQVSSEPAFLCGAFLGAAQPGRPGRRQRSAPSRRASSAACACG